MQETVLSNVRDANGAWPGAGPASAKFKVSTCHVCDELTFKEFRYLGIGNPYATPLPSNRALPMRQIRLIATATKSISTLFWLLGVGLCGFVLFALHSSSASPHLGTGSSISACLLSSSRCSAKSPSGRSVASKADIYQRNLHEIPRGASEAAHALSPSP